MTGPFAEAHSLLALSKHFSSQITSLIPGLSYTAELAVHEHRDVALAHDIVATAVTLCP